MVRALRVLEVSGDQVDQVIPENDERRVKYRELQKREFDFLEKLTLVRPRAPEYRFYLARSSFELEETAQALVILDSISPEKAPGVDEEPGYLQGHLLLADYYLTSGAKATSPSEGSESLKKALLHAELSLRQDRTNLEAMTVKAKVLYLQKDYDRAYQVFELLFVRDPSYFEALSKINNQLGRSEKNIELADDAITLLNDSLRNIESPSDPGRRKTWESLAKCYILKKDYETVETRLREEVNFQLKETGNTAWAKGLLTSVYIAWLREYPETSADSLRVRLELIKKAYDFNPDSELILRTLGSLGSNQNEEIASEAREIYDPSKDPDAPSMVLNDLGARSIAKKEHDLAIRYFEMARKKSPQHPEILNNLAYSYLVGPDPYPKRALTLADQAIRFLPNHRQAKRFRTYFHGTRAQALMQLKHMPQAIKDFKIALEDRPNDPEILAFLAECYQAADIKPPSDLEARLPSVAPRAGAEN